MDLNDAKTRNHELVPHKGFKLINGTHDPDDVDQIYNLEIRESDVFVVTYPKSGEREIKMEEHRGEERRGAEHRPYLSALFDRDHLDAADSAAPRVKGRCDSLQ